MPSVGAMEAMTRIGFAARGIMYVLIGYLALKSGRAKNEEAALHFLNDGSWKWLLAAMALGFLGYGIWRLSEAIVDTEGHGSSAKGRAVRAGGAVSGLVHLGLAFTAVKLAWGKDGHGSSEGARESAASTLSLPGGELIMALAAAALITTGLYQLVKAIRAGFLRHLDGRAARQPWIVWMGRLGYAARGVIFLIIGWFCWKSASSDDASEAGGLREALASLPDMLQLAAAVGLLLFGLFSLVEARFRRINDPRVLERLKAAVPG